VRANGHIATDDVARNNKSMKLTLSANEELVREYLERLAGKSDRAADAAGFERLSRLSQGDSRGWTFNREELHER